MEVFFSCILYHKSITVVQIDAIAELLYPIQVAVCHWDSIPSGNSNRINLFEQQCLSNNNQYVDLNQPAPDADIADCPIVYLTRVHNTEVIQKFIYS